MDRHYTPLKLSINNLPVIIYVAKDESPVTNILPTQKQVIDYVQALFSENPNIQRGLYAVVFVWNKNDKPMADVWMHSHNNHGGSDPLLECFAFAGKEQSLTGDVASGDTIIALAAEEQKRRQFSGFDEYLLDNSPAPFPEGLAPAEDYPA